MDALAALKAQQHAEGGFVSTVHARERVCDDLNGFVAAMVLRLLRHLPHDAAWAAMRERALDWIVRCRAPAVPGAFAFWPAASRPHWAQDVPADVDDTALMLGELLRGGRIERSEALRSVCTAVLPCRVASEHAAVLPPWVVPGCFFTWIAAPAPTHGPRKRAANVVDCVVNTNAVALMAQLGAQHLPGCDEAVQTVHNGLRWAAGDAARLASLTPFYPAPRSLVEAIEHAVECGAHALEPTLPLLRAALPAADVEGEPGLCRSAYGSTVWHAPAIGLARALGRAAARHGSVACR